MDTPRSPNVCRSFGFRLRDLSMNVFALKGLFSHYIVQLLLPWYAHLKIVRNVCIAVPKGDYIFKSIHRSVITRRQVICIAQKGIKSWLVLSIWLCFSKWITAASKALPLWKLSACLFSRYAWIVLHSGVKLRLEVCRHFQYALYWTQIFLC